MQEYFKIGEISKLYGIGADSLRYYEKIGLLQPERSESGYRHYSVREIWKLNIIRDLRELDFSMEQIGRYLQSHNVETTLSLLQEEETAIDEKIRNLQKLRENVRERIDRICAAEKQTLNTITLETYPARPCCSISEGYSDDNEMDVLIKRLINMDREHLYVIGSNRIGTAISMEGIQKEGKIRNRGVFVIDKLGKQVLPAGTYLTVTYGGGYEKSLFWAKKLLAYGQERGLKLKGDLLEILLVDIHTSQKEEEYITQLQILTEK